MKEEKVTIKPSFRTTSFKALLDQSERVNKGLTEGKTLQQIAEENPDIQFVKPIKVDAKTN